MQKKHRLFKLICLRTQVKEKDRSFVLDLLIKRIFIDISLRKGLLNSHSVISNGCYYMIICLKQMPEAIFTIRNKTIQLLSRPLRYNSPVDVVSYRKKQNISFLSNILYQSFVTTAPPPLHTHTYGEGWGIARQKCSAFRVSSP